MCHYWKHFPDLLYGASNLPQICHAHKWWHELHNIHLLFSECWWIAASKCILLALKRKGRDSVQATVLYTINCCSSIYPYISVSITFYRHSSFSGHLSPPRHSNPYRAGPGAEQSSASAVGQTSDPWGVAVHILLSLSTQMAPHQAISWPWSFCE